MQGLDKTARPGPDPADARPGRETARGRAKAERRRALVDHAARLFASQGFTRASTDELGAAAGISGPAVYRHFPTKQAVLAALLEGVSEELARGGEEAVAAASSPHDALARLVAFQVDFALRRADVIRVQDRDLPHLAEDSRRTVRRLQRRYVETWVTVLAELMPDVPRAELRVRAHAAFGLINSTPHALRAPGGTAAGDPPAQDRVRQTLTAMAHAALLTPAPSAPPDRPVPAAPSTPSDLSTPPTEEAPA